ncbi:facilitated trehalose transporter Tret1 like protein, partial [Danaus plexippus plexippus]
MLQRKYFQDGGQINQIICALL